jgi:RNA polymerase sigma factor (sigma-70 family)
MLENLNSIPSSRQINQSSETERLEKLKEEIFRERSYIQKVCYRLLGKGNKTDMAEDFTNEVLFQAIKNVAQYRGEATLKTWMTRIATNTIRAYWKKIQKEPSASGIPVEDFYSDLIDKRPNPEESLLKQEQTQIIQEALEKLGKRRQQILELFYTERMSYEKIAEKMGATVAAVRGLIYNARKEFGTHLGKNKNSKMTDENN